MERLRLRVLVTGSRGFVGKKLVERIRSSCSRLVEFDLRLGHDMTDPSAFARIEPVDTVVHLAARLPLADSFEESGELYRVNILGTLNVLEYCKAKQVKRIVYASSCVYGPPRYSPVDEEHPALVGNPYGRSKLSGEILCRAYYEDFGIVPVILRPFNIYGPGQDGPLLIPHIIRQVIGERSIRVRDLSPRRDYVFIDDVIEAYERAVFGPQRGALQVFNVGSGESFSVKEIIKKAQELAGTRKRVIEEKKVRSHEVSDCVADIRRIKRRLGWRPRTTLEEGLRQTIEYHAA